MSLKDPRIKKQAKVIVEHSLKVKTGENVAIYADFVAKPLVLELYEQLIKKGAKEIKLHFSDYEFGQIFFENASYEQLRNFPQTTMDEMKAMDCYISIRATNNLKALSGVDAKKIAQRSLTTKPIQDYRMQKLRWVVTEYPTNAQAQETDMSLSEYEHFVFSAINNVDWKKKFMEQEKIRKLVDATDKVHILAKDTDLTLSVKARKAENAGGEFNMPDGEIFTSAVENSAEGHVTYSFPAIFMGREFSKVRLEFEKGKVVRARSDKNEKDLNNILDMDKGARFIGELGLGNNYKINKFVKNILFDEKIGGTIHIALGRGYPKTLSKNNSALHWDMIKDLRSGGELYFDNKLVQKNGNWLI
ncbi:aminopeptidase [Candidatus Woesebacteria bacterium]|nr:aminopeptidase [Candidatus Woesebacteria bacterium]